MSKDVKFEMNPEEIAQIIKDEREGVNLLPLLIDEEAIEQEMYIDQRIEEYFANVRVEIVNEWKLAHPNHCKKCDGWGEIHEPGSYMEPPHDYDCDYCLFAGKCPHCGSPLELFDEEEDGDDGEVLDPGSVVSSSVELIDGDAGRYIGKCSCGWEYGMEGLPYLGG